MIKKYSLPKTEKEFHNILLEVAWDHLRSGIEEGRIHRKTSKETKERLNSIRILAAIGVIVSSIGIGAIFYFAETMENRITENVVATITNDYELVE